MKLITLLLRRSTIWAKVFTLETQSYNALFQHIYIHSDTIWVLLNTDSRGYYNGFILLYDKDGQLIKNISILTSINNVNQIGFLETKSITTFDQNSVIISCSVVQAMSSIGYSEDSFYDVGILKLDSKGNFIWGTVEDYNLNFDSDSSTFEYDSKVYTSFFSNDLHLCFAILNGDNGTLIKSSCLSFPSISSDENSDTRTIEMFTISENLSVNMKYYTYEYYESTQKVKFKYASLFNNEIYLFGRLNYLISDTDNILGMTLKVNVESLQDSCSTFNSVPNDILYKNSYVVSNQDFEELLYSYDSNNLSFIFSVNSTINVKYYQRFEAFKSPGELAIYKEINVTDCIWPEYCPLASECNPTLPEFILNNYIIFKVGSNLDPVYTLKPFESCQNIKFFIRVCQGFDNNVCIIPSWVTINQTSSTVIIDSSRIISVGSFIMIFEAQIVSYTFSEDQTQRTIASNNNSTLIFTNNNCKLIESNAEFYIIKDQLKNYTILFSDDENDKIYLSVINNNGVNTYAMTINSTAFSLFMLSADENLTVAFITLAYYDKYHQDSSQWRFYNISINIYTSEPPKFSSNLENISINRCLSDYASHLLPSIVDPDNNDYEILLIDNSPKWVKIITDTEVAQISSFSNTYMVIDLKDANIENGNYTINLKIIDNYGSFTKYSCIASIISDSSGILPIMNNISMESLTSLTIKLEISNIKNIKIQYCDSNNDVDWACYSSILNSIVINNSSVCNGFLSSNTNLCNTIQTSKAYCINLIGNDLCGNSILSNKFNVSFIPNTPPASANIFSVKVYQRHYIETELPDSLFLSKSMSFMNYQSSNCIDGSNIKIATQIRNNTSGTGLILFVKVYGEEGCIISIISTDSFCQKSEVLVKINV